MTEAAPRPSWGRRIARFPLTRLVVAVAIYGLSFPLGALLATRVTGLYWQWVVGKAVASLFALVALVVTVRLMERRPLEELAGPPRSALAQVAVGFAGAAATVSACIGIFAAVGWYHVLDVAWVDELLPLTLLFLFVALDEELAFRGIFFRTVEDGLGSWAALILSGLFFGFAHGGNQNASVFTSTAIAIEAGLLLGAVYLATRRMWPLFGIHWAWNLFEGPVWGTPVSGISLPSVVTPVIDGPSAWTGGAFGPEGGSVMVLLCSLISAALLGYVVWTGKVRGPMWRRRSGELLPPSSGPEAGNQLSSQ